MKSGGLRTKGITKISTQEKPVITVATVVYNGSKTLETTIKSIINQTYDNIEYIIIDGGSTDNTIEIIKKYEDIIDYWQSEPDKGIYDAMNKALEFAKGDFLIFLGADDCFFQNDTLDLCVKKLKPNCLNYGLVYFKNNPYIYWGKFSKMQIFYQNICHQSIFYPKMFYSNNNYNIHYCIYADWEMNIRAYSVCKFNYIPLVISVFNEYGTCSKVKDTFKHDRIKIIIKENGLFKFLLYLLFVPCYFCKRLLKYVHKRVFFA